AHHGTADDGTHAARPDAALPAFRGGRARGDRLPALATGALSAADAAHATARRAVERPAVKHNFPSSGCGRRPSRSQQRAHDPRILLDRARPPLGLLVGEVAAWAQA